MRDMTSDISALQEMSARLLTIAKTERRWNADALREHARDLDQIALELLLEGEFGADPQHG